MHERASSTMQARIPEVHSWPWYVLGIVSMQPPRHASLACDTLCLETPLQGELPVSIAQCPFHLFLLLEGRDEVSEYGPPLQVSLSRGS